ncbi:MAG: CBS domain-containing protein, partial [Rufibacter sp.]
NALLPLLAACTGSYFVSFFLMENTIMTEKIARRGVKTPDSYEPDILEKITVAQVIQEEGLVLSEDNSIGEVREWLAQESGYQSNYFIIASNENEFRGIVSSSNLFSHHHPVQNKVGSLIKRKSISVDARNSLRTAVELMARENLDMLPVVSKENQVVGVLSYQNILLAYKHNIEEHEQKDPHISLKRKSLKILLRGQRLMNAGRKT